MYKICILSTELFPVGGTSVRTLNFARSLVKYGNEVHIAGVTPKDRAQYHKNERYDGIHVHTLVVDYPKLRKGFRSLYYVIVGIQYLRWTKQLINKYNFNIIHCAALDMCVIGILLKKILKKPVLGDLHACRTIEYENPITKIITKIKEKYVCKYADVIIVPTQELKEVYTSWGIKPEKIHVVRNTIDIAKFVPKKPREEIRRMLKVRMNEKVAIFHGSLGTSYNIRALHELQKISKIILSEVDSIKFLIVGNYNEKIDIDNSIYTGYVDNLPDYINAADFAIVPIYANSFGIRSRCIEYFVLSIPVITTSAGTTGMHFAEGAVIAKDNNQDIAKAAIELIQNSNKLAEMKKNCENIVGRFDPEIAANKLILIYSKIA